MLRRRRRRARAGTSSCPRAARPRQRPSARRRHGQRLLQPDRHNAIPATIGKCRYEKESRATAFARARERRSQPPSRHERDHVEVQPPQRGGRPDRRSGRRHDPRVDAAYRPRPRSPRSTRPARSSRSARGALRSGPARASSRPVPNNAGRPCRAPAPAPDRDLHQPPRSRRATAGPRPPRCSRQPEHRSAAASSRRGWRSGTARCARPQDRVRTDKQQAASPNAPARTAPPPGTRAIATKIARRTAPSSGSTTLVSQAYPTHDHHSIPSTSRPLSIPPRLGFV